MSIPKFWGSIRLGIVEDNFDPTGQGRVRVRVLADHGNLRNDELAWAKLCSISAGPGRGTVLPPNKGDYVWLLYENFNPMFPVIIGYSFTPPPEYSQQTNDNMGGMKNNNTKDMGTEYGLPGEGKGTSAQVLYKSKRGAEIAFYEEDKKETFRLIDSLGQIIEFGSQTDEETAPRSSGDRSRKPVKPDNGAIRQGYIRIQVAADENPEKKAGKSSNKEGDMTDPKIFLAPDTVHLDNSTSKISAEKDHIVMHNGKATFDIIKQNIKTGNQVSSIGILSSDDSQKEEDSTLSETNEGSDQKTARDQEDENDKKLLDGGKDVIIITNGDKNIKITLKDKDLIISVPGDVSVGVEGKIDIKSKGDISINTQGKLNINAREGILMNAKEEGNIVLKGYRIHLNPEE